MLFLCAQRLPAQAAGTATQMLRLQAYGMASYVRPDFGGALKNAGGTLGATLNAVTLFPAEIGLDVRAVGSGGRVSKEFFYGGGPRAQFDLGRVQPYAAVHLGYGRIDFQYPPTPTYTYDNSFVVGYTGGVDVQVRPGSAWALRAEVERQRWKLSKLSPPFYPLAISVGVRYQFRFGSRAGTN